jgi:hypothetical protein
MMEAVHYTETPANVEHITRYHIQEDILLVQRLHLIGIRHYRGVKNFHA